MSDGDTLIAAIHGAFADVTYPGDDGLAPRSHGLEPEDLVAAFQGHTDWRTVPARTLDRTCDGSALAFFSDAALRFYLPAYLCADLRGELALAAPEVRLTAGLSAQSEGERLAKAWGGGTAGDHARRAFDPLDPAQAAAVITYLRWKQVRGGDDLQISEAIERYWLDRAQGVRMGQEMEGVAR